MSKYTEIVKSLYELTTADKIQWVMIDSPYTYSTTRNNINITCYKNSMTIGSERNISCREYTVLYNAVRANKGRATLKNVETSFKIFKNGL
jgi:hypothetical protein